MARNTLNLPIPERGTHKCAIPHTKTHHIRVALVGCGGNGSQMLTKLARLDYALRETTCPYGFMVDVFDPDVVTRANVGRQMFSPADVGHYKAVVLTHRLNAYFGLSWRAVAGTFEGRMDDIGMGSPPDILITCLDTAEARRNICGAFTTELYGQPRYWLDLGNSRSTGQVILGEPQGSPNLQVNFADVNAKEFVAGLSRAAMEKRIRQAQIRRRLERLPTLWDMFPELLSPDYEEENEPSCSVAAALEKQSLFINDNVTSAAAELLDRLLRLGKIQNHGAFVNLDSLRTNPLPIRQVSAGEVDAEFKRELTEERTKARRRAA